MAQRKPNYHQARSDRSRAKEQKKQERLRQRERDSLERKAARATELDELVGSSEDLSESSPPARD